MCLLLAVSLAGELVSTFGHLKDAAPLEGAEGKQQE